MSDLRAALESCRFCGKPMMERHALWPSEGDTDAIIHAEPTDCPVTDYSIGNADEGKSVREAWNRRARSALAGDGETVREALAIVADLHKYSLVIDSIMRHGPDTRDRDKYAAISDVLKRARSLSALPSPMPPPIRCDYCDNGVEAEWEFCAWCSRVLKDEKGERHPPLCR